MALINQGADAVAGAGLDNARRAARRGADREGSGLAAFASFSGGHSRYNSGSQVDMNSFALLTGLSYGSELPAGFLTLGAFFEYANGGYDTYNSFHNAASVRGDGDAHSVGGGLLGRLDFQPAGPGHFYAEVSGRAGRLYNDYSAAPFSDVPGLGSGYDANSAYYSLHTGLGYLWNLSGKSSLDLYGKYFWTHQNGADVTLSTNDPVKFDDLASKRLRAGGRFSYALSEYASPYLGAAYEHEFDNRARATTYGYAIEDPNLRGDIGIGEMGLTVAWEALPLSLDLACQGYVGQREGLGVSLEMKYEF
ncbi:MAG: autotransporter outer membrane beta-barrel domain-containing protein [Candidatus Adiutrix sp.]|jgi:outer membrane autotransporter protein|nr:autotransporter outer membrane beta-barrel domain-containing protein [Candidatus Adiutrix sp.]